jgi:hypothetical protein
MEFNLTAQDINALVAEIESNRPHLETDPKKIFCDGWPTAKQALAALQQMLSNPIGKGAVALVIAAGDGIHGKIC